MRFLGNVFAFLVLFIFIYHHHLHNLMKNLSVSYLRKGQDINASLKGSLVSLAAIKFKAELAKKKMDPWDRLIIDLTKVTEVDTTGVNSLFQTQMRCVHKNIMMILKCQNDHPVKELLKITHSERQFDIELAQ